MRTLASWLWRSIALACAVAAFLGVAWFVPNLSAATGSDPASPDALVPVAETLSGSYLAGRFAQYHDDWTAAAQYMDDSMERDPGSGYLLHRAFQLALGQGQIEEAVSFAHKLEPLDQSDQSVAVLLVADDVVAGRYDDARSRLAQLAKDQPEPFLAPLLLAWVETAGGDRDAALGALQPLAEIKGLRPLYALQAALINDVTGRQDEAARWYQEALAGGQPVRVTELAGNFDERTGRTGDARKLYEALRATDPDNSMVEALLERVGAAGPPAPAIADARQGMAEALFDIASAMNQDSVSQVALLYGRIALYLRPDFPLMKLMVGDDLSLRGREEDALELYRSVGGGWGLQWAARMRAVDSLERLHQTDAAVALLTEMATERPERVDDVIRLGDLYRGHKQFDKAIEVYSRALGRLPPQDKRTWMLLYGRGVAYERTGQWNQAEADLGRAVKLSPDQPSLLNYLGYSWVDRGVHLDDAKSMIEKAVTLRPDDGYIVDSLGWASYKLGDYAAAVSHLEQAVELKPLDATINGHLGDAYWRAGRHAEARYQWERALRFVADSDDPALAGTLRAKLAGGSLPSEEAAPAAVKK